MSYLRREIKTRRILLKPSLQDFDRINTCHVTYEQFTRALTKLGLNLPDICFKVLARKYMDRNNTREVNYVNFLQDVDDAHLMYGENYGIPDYLIQKQLEYQKQFGESDILGGQKFGPLPGEELKYTTSSYPGKPAAGNVNGLNAGPSVKIANEQEQIKQVAETNVGNADKVDNRGFFTSQKESSRPEFGGSQLDTIKNVEELEEKLKAYIVMKKIRLHEFLIDIDKLRKGYCSLDQFRRVMELTGVQLSEKHIEMLFKKYGRDDDLFNYAAFSKNIKEILTKKGIQKDPLHSVYQITSDTTLPARRYYMRMTEDEKNKLNHLLSLIKKEIETRRLLFKPHFQDFDQTNNGYVTRSQFLRVLYQFDIYPSDAYLNVLLKCYTDNSNLNEVNYYAFCQDVDGQDNYTKKINDTHASMFLQPKADNNIQPYIYKDNPKTGLEEVISKLQKKVKEQRIRVHEFLRDFDRLRSGSITSAQLRIGLNMAKLPLSNREFKILCENFACSKKPGWFRWRDFCDKIDEVFTVKGLERNPDSKIGGSILLTKTVRQGMSNPNKEIAERIIRKFRYYCLATRLFIKQFFQDWDRLGRNKVSPKQFRQVLATVKFDMTDDEFHAVADYFKTEDGYVNYVDFIKATNPDNAPLDSLGMTKAQHTSSNVLNNFGASGGPGGPVIFQSQTYKGGDAGEAQQEAKRLDYVPGYSAELKMMEEGHIPNYSYMIDLNVDPIKVLEKVKRDVKISRTRLREFLQDFDPLRKGYITQNKFFGSLDKLK